jgi:hypothetical protein
VACDVFYCCGVFFSLYKLFLVENRVTRIMFELKTEEMGGEGCKMCSFIICTACHIPVYQRTVEKCVRNVACLGMKVIVNRFLIGKQEGKSPFRRPCENGRIMLKWVLRMDFDHSCFERALNVILMKSVLNSSFHKIVGNMLIR